MSHEVTRRNYDRLSQWYDLFSGSEKRFTHHGLRLLDVQPGERVLEIGCGTGEALLDLSRAGRASAIDLSPGMLKQARARAARAGMLEKSGFCMGDALHLPYISNAFDAVFMSFTLELFPDPEIPLVLAECRRILQNGGRLGIVSLARADTFPVKVYEWFHARLPDIIDCRPILPGKALSGSGFKVSCSEVKTMWGLPVEIVVAGKA